MTDKPIISRLELVACCGGCPSDWEAQDHLGRYVYIRYRWGHLTVRVSETEATLFNEAPIMLLQHGDPYDGVMSADEMVELTKGVIDWVPNRIHYGTAQS